MLDILSSLGCPPHHLFCVNLVCNHTVTPIVSLVSRPLEASSDHPGNGHRELWTGYADYHVSSHVSCQVGRWVIVRVQELNHRVSDDIYSKVIDLVGLIRVCDQKKIKLNGYGMGIKIEEQGRVSNAKTSKIKTASSAQQKQSK